ncbi:MAG: undecaprenyl diphosphate synthase family protein, partial [Candidatus Pacearchaeota archaeon]
FALAYGGRQEIMQAIKNIVKEGTAPEEITEELITDNLCLTDEPDLIIRTGGEKRLSNFLPWQSTYSELFFIDKLWPEFSKKDMQEIIGQFKDRKRNFGK